MSVLSAILAAIAKAVLWVGFGIVVKSVEQSRYAAVIIAAVSVCCILAGCASLATDRWRTGFRWGRLIASMKWTLAILCGLVAVIAVLLALRR